MIPRLVEEAVRQLPETLQDSVEENCGAIAEAGGFEGLSEASLELLPQLLAVSQFATHILRRKPVLLAEIAAQDGPSAQDALAFKNHLQQRLAECSDMAMLKQALRDLRQQEMLRLAWRDIAGLDDLDATLNGLSGLADMLIDAALRWLELRHAEKHGQPQDASGRAIRLVVLGMGKLGGDELNFSSDIDLVFAYREAGQTTGAKPLSHEEYFRGLAQQLVQVLNEHTEHGFVFRVDTRLRPFGDSGPLVMHFEAMEQYYQTHGREWERYAWIKARPVAGDIADGQALLKTLRPFVYRRYLDYGVYESLRDMKAMIERETLRKGMQRNIKLGRGGIREIEFIAQVYQLIRGGQDVELQERGLRRILGLLGQRELLPAETVAELDAAYVFLRRLENRLQAYADQQTHDLPKDDVHRAAMVLAMGVDDWETLATEIEAVRARVYGHFQRVFGQVSDDTAQQAEEELTRLWLGMLEGQAAQQALTRLGYGEPDAVLDELAGLRTSSRVRHLGESARRRLDECIPLMITAAATVEQPERVLGRMLGVLQALVGRTTYIALLVENASAVPQLARLCAASPWIAEQLQHHPMLLDNLLDPRQLYSPPRQAELEHELMRQVRQIEAVDLERLMDCVRRFRQTSALRVAAADVSGAVPLMVVSDHLTEIAEVVMQQALQAIQMQLFERHGRPLRADGTEAGFAVIAYGKFGGIELGYGSDLDLVFIQDGESNGMTDGERPLLHDVYFNRLGQRLMHFLSAYTPAGRAYEVDMRLRPNGESGLLVPGFEALARYQHEQAWTWEHQALVRARYIAGSADLGKRFLALRHAVLATERDPEKLRTEVAEMREKMRMNLEKREAGCIDLKQGRGGITDIEFITQYFVLRYSHEYPELTRWTDNIRILETLRDCGLWTADEVAVLCDAYRHLRRAIHRQSLQSQPAVVSAQDYDEEIQQVKQAWERHMGAAVGE